MAAARAARRGTMLLLALLLVLGVPALAEAAAPASVPAHVDQKKPPTKAQKAQKKALKKKRAEARKRAQKAARAKALAHKRAVARWQAEQRRAAAKRKRYAPGDSTAFNYPLSPYLSDRFKIRRQIRLAIQYTPPGGRIRLATFNFDDEMLATQLIAAHARGVSVQVVIANKNGEGASFKRLQRGLKRKPDVGAPRTGKSYARTCRYSCRGTRGLVHTKVYLFSNVGRTKYVSMVGSANLTRFAAVGQWNHMNTVVGRTEYRQLLRVFDQMRRDRPAKPITFSTKKMTVWVYPRRERTIADDPMAQALRRISCGYRPIGAKSKKVRRTTIRIAMYAWFDEHGNDLARLVRQKWDQGCDVKVLYAVSNGTVLRVLRDRSGRGAIPVRRTATFDAAGEVVDYNHSKYVAVRGRYSAKRTSVVWTGSMNWTALGLTSDELLVRLPGSRVYTAYARNFSRVWNGPATR